MNQLIPRPEVSLAEEWMILVFLFALVTLAYTRSTYPMRIKRLWSSMWNVRIMRQAIREEPNTPRANLLFNISFYLLASLVLFLTLKYFHIEIWGMHGIGMYLILLASLTAAYAIKVIGIRMVQVLADGDFGLTEYEYNVFLMNRGIGIFLFPLACLLAYLPQIQIHWLIIAAGIIFGMMVLYRMGRGLLNAASEGIPIFYIFFYICTLEILPLVVCVKALSR